MSIHEEKPRGQAASGTTAHIELQQGKARKLAPVSGAREGVRVVRQVVRGADQFIPRAGGASHCEGSLPWILCASSVGHEDAHPQVR